MDTIKCYLENMFAGLPATKEILGLKENLAMNMEEKYQELKGQGKSENEAVGIVISEFGNIDELLTEMGIEKNTSDNGKMVTEKEAFEFIQVSEKVSHKIGLGIFLCVTAPGVFIYLKGILMEQRELFGQTFRKEQINVISLIPLFVMIAVAIGIFVVNGMKMERFEYLKKEEILLDPEMERKVRSMKDQYQPGFVVGIVIGIIMCVFAPLCYMAISQFVGSGFLGNGLGVLILLTIIAIAVWIFTRKGMVYDSYKQLLQVDEYSMKGKEEDKVIASAAAVYWPMVIIGYLTWSFISGDWGITWIVWPIAGILFGSFASSRNISQTRK